MSDDYGLTGGVHDDRHERRHERRVAKLPWGLRQTPNKTPKVPLPEPLTSDELELILQLVPRLKYGPRPLPEGSEEHIIRVVRLAEYLHRPN